MGSSKKNAGSRAATAQNQFLEQALAGIQPFQQAGAAQLPALTAGATQQGLESSLQSILGGDAFGSLVGERQSALQGQLAAGGLTRSGTALQKAAAIPTDLAFQIENMLSGRQQGLAQQGLGAAGASAGIFGQQGENVSAGILSDAQAQAAGLSQLGNIGSSLFFSDPRLKINTEKVSDIGDLSVYQWDWIPEAEGTVIWNNNTVGFMADEVKEKYPDRVEEVNGWMMIDYHGLCNDLRGKYLN